MDKKAQEYEASTGKHFSCGQDFCKQCGQCSRCLCTCKSVKKIKIGIIRKDEILYVYSDRPDEIDLKIADLDAGGSEEQKKAIQIESNLQEI